MKNFPQKNLTPRSLAGSKDLGRKSGGSAVNEDPMPAVIDGDVLELIELFFFAYRDFVGDADRLLENYGFGRAHHRVLHFVQRRPGLSIAALLPLQYRRPFAKRFELPHYLTARRPCLPPK